MEYVRDCLESTWISSNGSYIDRFERGFAEYCGVQHALSCANGTVALHLALLALGIGPGDEVICPTLTYVATANCVSYCGATPVFVDSELETWNIDPERVIEAFTPRTRAIIVVHLYGHPAKMDVLLDAARERGIAVIEDAAEAHGALYNGRVVGGLGDIATFSFYGNKILTTGEGGMVVTDDDELASRVRLLKGQGQDPARRYWFPVVGFNYRMTNIAAAIGLAQLENVDWLVARRRENLLWYRELLGENSRLVLSPEAAWATSVHWMSCAVLQTGGATERDEIMRRLDCAGSQRRGRSSTDVRVAPNRRRPQESFPGRSHSRSEESTCHQARPLRIRRQNASPSCSPKASTPFSVSPTRITRTRSVDLRAFPTHEREPRARRASSA